MDNVAPDVRTHPVPLPQMKGAQAPRARRPTAEQQRRARDAEMKLKQWLDRCWLPFIYVEQSMLTMPAPLLGQIKRPDWIIGIPNIGRIAVDVKSKTLYRDHILIEADEYRKFRMYETCFSESVWYLNFPPGEPYACHLFRNRDLDLLRPEPSRGKEIFWVPLRLTHLTDVRGEFTPALLNAISLKRGVPIY